MNSFRRYVGIAAVATAVAAGPGCDSTHEVLTTGTGEQSPMGSGGSDDGSDGADVAANPAQAPPMCVASETTPCIDCDDPATECTALGDGLIVLAAEFSTIQNGFESFSCSTLIQPIDNGDEITGACSGFGSEGYAIDECFEGGFYHVRVMHDTGELITERFYSIDFLRSGTPDVIAFTTASGQEHRIRYMGSTSCNLDF